ncbi:MAG: hypothetical protein WBN40_10000 [Pseudomonadales bacterium]
MSHQVKIILRFILLAILVLSGGCVSTLPWSLMQSRDDVLRLAERHEYAAALALVERRIGSEDEPLARAEWLALQGELQSRAAEHAVNLGREIDQLVEMGNWREAGANIGRFEQRLPQNEMTVQRVSNWREEQREQQRKLEASWLLMRARQLPEALVLARQRQQLAPASRQLKRKAAALGREADSIYEQLSARLSAAEAAEEYDTALLYARALHRLQPSEALDARLAGLRTQSEAGTERVARPQTIDNAAMERKYQQLLSEYGKALVDEEWLQARQVLNRLLQLRPGEAELLGQDTHLTEIFTREVESARREGEQLYSAGEVEAALSVWRDVQPLAGDDPQLNANIERAQRILDKVKALTIEADAVEAQPVVTD